MARTYVQLQTRLERNLIWVESFRVVEAEDETNYRLSIKLVIGPEKLFWLKLSYKNHVGRCPLKSIPDAIEGPKEQKVCCPLIFHFH